MRYKSLGIHMNKLNTNGIMIECALIGEQSYKLQHMYDAGAW